MAFLILNISVMCISILTVILSVIYIYFQYLYNYWNKLGIPYLKPKFPYGNCYKVFTEKLQFGENLAELYKNIKAKGYTYGGIYVAGRPCLVAVSPDFVKFVLTRDFVHFHDRGFYYNEDEDPLSAHLFALEGQKWKNMRAKLTPTYTPGKLKAMFQTLLNCSLELRDCLNESIKRKEPVDLKRIFVQYTTDVIGSCAFGIECNSFKDPHNEFLRTSEKIFNLTRLERLKFLFAFNFPKVAKFFKVCLNSPEVSNFFNNVVKQTVEYRENNNIVRSDFMHLLLQLKNHGYLKDDEDTKEKNQKTTTKLTMNQLPGQVFVFFAAGFETSSTAMTWCFCELSQNQTIQDKLREEIIKVLKQYDGEITYEALMEMTYLDCVINETLRKYPPLPFLQRIVTKDYLLPHTNKVLAKGTRTLIPVYGLHHDPEFYPNPEEFDPNRFTDQNKRTRPDYTWLPFGEGPHMCIGLRFAMLQVKVGICQLLMKYKFTLHGSTKIPILVNPLVVTCSPKDTIWLNAEQICTSG